MSKYTFTFKKDDIFVEFVTTDKDVVEQQFAIWVNAATNYIKHGPQKVKKVSEQQIQSPTPATNDIVETKEEEQQFSEQTQPAEEALTEKADVQPELENMESEPEESVENKQETFDNASELLRTINSIQEEKIEEQPVQTPDFDNILEKTIENPTFEPNKAKDDRYISLIKAKRTNDSFHYLVITAYYLSEVEKLERFSLKQINAKLMNNLSAVIDHSILQEAINQNLLELVPDLTETSEVTEYRLTEAGESFFINNI